MEDRRWRAAVLGARGGEGEGDEGEGQRMMMMRRRKGRMANTIHGHTPLRCLVGCFLVLCLSVPQVLY